MASEEKILKLIEMYNEVFMQHRYGRVNQAFEEEAKALAVELYTSDTDGSISKRVAEACKAFIAEELRLHPPGTVNPYADSTPEAASEDTSIMTREELLAKLDENAEDCIHELGTALYDKVDADEDLQDPEILVFVLWMWNTEIQNGGLCQFFVNEGAYASLVPSALEAVGATEYAALLHDFVTKHNIALDDLSQFDLDIESLNEDMIAYVDATELYSFDDFDNAYYELYSAKPLEGYMAAYIRKNIDSFVQA